MAIPYSTEELSEKLENFRIWLCVRKGLQPTTIQNFLGTVRRAAPHIGLDPTEAAIDRYMLGLYEGRKSCAYILSTITGLERFMDFVGHPMKLGRPRKPQPILKTILTEAEVARIIGCAQSPRERAILILLAYSGIRNAELCNLKNRDVKFPEQMICVEDGKGSKDRAVCVSGDCIEALTDYLYRFPRSKEPLNPDDRLFSTVRHHYPLDPQDLRKIVRVAARRAGIKKRVHPHLLRHSLATNMIDRGAHILTVRDQLGHVFVDSTMVYVHRSKKTHSNDYRQHAPSYL